jgi:hypothetical protein
MPARGYKDSLGLAGAGWWMFLALAGINERCSLEQYMHGHGYVVNWLHQSMFQTFGDAVPNTAVDALA